MKKRILSIFLCVIFIMASLPLVVLNIHAEEGTYYDGVWRYRIENNYAVLTGVSESITGEVCGPPASLGGYPLKVIEWINIGGFWDGVGIQTKQFIIPRGVERIEDYALNSSGFISIVLPLSLKYIGWKAFDCCYNLTTVYYEGAPEDWEEIEINFEISNRYLVDATKYYGYVYDNSDESNSPDYDNEDEKYFDMVRAQLPNINLGPYVLKGAYVPFLGNRVPLINIEAAIKININDFLTFEREGDIIKVICGYNAGPDEVDTNKKDAYQKIKSIYKSFAGQNCSTSRLLNEFRSLKGNLRKLDAKVLIDVDILGGGYFEFKINKDDTVEPLEGGILIMIEATYEEDIPIHYPLFAYVEFSGGVTGEITFWEAGKWVSPRLFTKLELGIAMGLKIKGCDNFYLRGDFCGKLISTIDTYDELNVYALFGGRIKYMLFHEKFSKEYEIPIGNRIQLYPHTEEQSVTLMSSELEVDTSTVESYNQFINSMEAIERDYLYAPYSLRSLANFSGASFIKDNSYPMSKPQLVSFDNDNMLLVWVDDTGEKTLENMGSLMYSHFDGSEWSAPEVLFEDGKYNDVPQLYSNGKHAYIIWQKATETFKEGTELSDMLLHFDLYTTVFDIETKSFTDPVCVNKLANRFPFVGPEDVFTDTESNNTNAISKANIFEFNHNIYAKNGSYIVAWVENSDNNIYQSSGVNSLFVASFDENNNSITFDTVITTDKVITNIEICDKGVYYSLLDIDNDINDVYYWNKNFSSLVAENIGHFDCENGKLFYADANGFYSFDGASTVEYSNVGNLNDFVIESNGDDYVMFVSVLNEDFTRNIYYSQLSAETKEWSDFELYSSRGKTIYSYSPVILSDGTIHIAVNYVTEDENFEIQSAAVVVDQCNDDVDIEVVYATFDNNQLEEGVLDLVIGIDNNSSTVIEKFNVEILNEENETVYTQEVETKFGAFESKEITVSFDIPDNYNNELYSIKVTPVDYTDWNENNNMAQTTFECSHYISDEWTVVVEPTVKTKGIKAHCCTICGAWFDETEIDCLVLGDVNGDRLITNADVLQIYRYIYNPELYPLNVEVGDVNGDGYVTNADVLAIFRYIYNPGLYPLG